MWALTNKCGQICMVGLVLVQCNNAEREEARDRTLARRVLGDGHMRGSSLDQVTNEAWSNHPGPP